jgi:hypothetical protein
MVWLWFAPRHSSAFLRTPHHCDIGPAAPHAFLASKRKYDDARLRLAVLNRWFAGPWRCDGEALARPGKMRMMPAR